jgi:hypothetical protein
VFSPSADASCPLAALDAPSAMLLNAPAELDGPTATLWLPDAELL